MNRQYVAATIVAFTLIIGVAGGTNIVSLDNDSLTEIEEVQKGTNFLDADTDNDGIKDGVELSKYNTSPTSPDTDEDGLADRAEINEYNTSPTSPDTDEDGLADRAEINEYNTSPTSPDTDEDGLADGAEINEYNTSPTSTDTDEDGLADGAEINEYNTSPTSTDTDEDGLNDTTELTVYETDPVTADTDEDGLADGAEVTEYNTDPTSIDTDSDGSDDATEIERGTDPAIDTDNDGLNDWREKVLNTDPTRADTDGDTLSDGVEFDGRTANGVELPNSDPLSKDVYLQISYGASATAKTESFVDDLQAQWSTMPVENPDGSEGIDIHVQQGPNRSETIIFTGNNAREIKSEYYTDNVGNRAGVYHNIMFVEFNDGDEYDGYAAKIPGHFGIVETNMEPRNQRNMIIHELLHGIVGRPDSDAFCGDEGIHICQNGWLDNYVNYGEDEFLSPPTIEKIEKDGFEE